jgi:hypothetical protein
MLCVGSLSSCSEFRLLPGPAHEEGVCAKVALAATIRRCACQGGCQVVAMKHVFIVTSLPSLFSFLFVSCICSCLSHMISCSIVGVLSNSTISGVPFTSLVLSSLPIFPLLCSSVLCSLPSLLSPGTLGPGPGCPNEARGRSRTM